MTPFCFASPISSGRKPTSVVLCAMGGIRTIEDRTPRSARPTTVSSTTLRTRRVPFVPIAAGKGRVLLGGWPAQVFPPGRAHAPRHDQRLSGSGQCLAVREHHLE